MTLTAEQLQRATQAKSDQLNSCDIMGGSLVAKILDVKAGNADQPVIIVIDSWPQPWKPSKTSLRVLCACWGNDPQQWVGRYAVLYNDESVTWGGEAVGGIRTSHLSHIDRQRKISVNVKKNKKGAQIVDPYYPQDVEQPAAEPTYWPDESFAKQLANAQAKLDSGEVTADQVIERLEKKALLTVGQKARIKPSERSIVLDGDNLEPPSYEDEDPFAAE